MNIVIIGAGVGGLTAGAYLAEQGHTVTVFEKASTVGGAAGWYSRRNMMFPTGATIAYGLEEEGIWRRIFDDLGVKVEARKLTHPMNVVLSDRTIAIVHHRQHWFRELAGSFPERKQNVAKFWQTIEQISKSVAAITEARLSLPLQTWADVRRLVRFAMNKPHHAWTAFRYSMSKVDSLLRKYKLDDYKPFVQFLNAQLMDAVQVDASKAALLPSSLALDIYRSGSYHVEGGIGRLSEQLAEKIQRTGGEVHVSAAVNTISYDKTAQKWTVGTKTKVVYADVLIDNTGSTIAQPFFKPRKFTAPKVKWGAVRMDAVLSDEILHFLPHKVKLPFALQIVPSEHNAIIFGDLHGPVYATFHEAVNRKGQVVPNKIVLTVSVHSESQRWERYTEEEYEARKKLIADAFLEELNTVMPLQQYLDHYDIGTPNTYYRYIGKHHVGGNPLTRFHGIAFPEGVKTSHPRLYRVGEQVFPGPGTLSASLSGFFAARAISERQFK